MPRHARIIEGTAVGAAGCRFAVVVSKYQRLRDRSAAGGRARGAGGAPVSAPDDITVVRVPGAFEIPSAARHAAETGGFDAIVCLGCLIRGATPHFEYIASAVVARADGRGRRRPACR